MHAMPHVGLLCFVSYVCYVAAVGLLLLTAPVLRCIPVRACQLDAATLDLAQSQHQPSTSLQYCVDNKAAVQLNTPVRHCVCTHEVLSTQQRHV
jgi:hypothetical protein